MTILWALDAAENLAEFNRPMVSLLRQLCANADVTIIPVCLVSRHRYTKFLMDDGALDTQRLESELEEWLEKLALPKVQPVRIVTYDALVPTLVASELAQQARDAKADMMAAVTHAHHGPKRWLLGSVSETLLRESDIPLVVCRGGNDAENFFNADVV